MTHLDLFSGIGGFAYAADQVFGDVEHIFCDNEPFAQQVLKKHWPEAYIYEDIRDITNTEGQGLQGRKHKGGRIDILTGGFPCQPFSAAGVRRGTADQRYLWPEMFRVIRLTKPTWVIAENVRGLATWQQGVVLEQVCTDLESEGYEVQPFIIPAVAVGAPHRRDRIWVIAYAQQPGLEGRNEQTPKYRQNQGLQPWSKDWQRDWTQVATELCSLDDGLPVTLDGLKLSKPQHRQAQLKAYGNAIVPQVAMEIMKGMMI